jgi:hypothetical protein
MKKQIEEGKRHSANMGTLFQLQASIESCQTEVEHLHDLVTKEMSKLEQFCTVDLPSFKTLHDSFAQAQSKQPTDLQHILQTVDDRIKENIRTMESKLESLPAAAHVVQMIHDETKIHDLVKRVDDAERAIFDHAPTPTASTGISQDAISAMVDTRMVTYNASDKDELRSILANQRRVLEDIELRLRNLDAENDDRIENIVDTRMQRNTIVDQHQLQLLLSTHQSTLQQTVTNSLTAIQKEKTDVAKRILTSVSSMRSVVVSDAFNCLFLK